MTDKEQQAYNCVMKFCINKVDLKDFADITENLLIIKLALERLEDNENE